MLDYLEKLRKQPEPQRKKAVLKLSASITLVVVCIWGAFIALRVMHTDFSFSPKKIDLESPDFKTAYTNLIESMSKAFEPEPATSTVSASTSLEATTEIESVVTEESASLYPALEQLFGTTTETVE